MVLVFSLFLTLISEFFYFKKTTYCDNELTTKSIIFKWFGLNVTLLHKSPY